MHVTSHRFGVRARLLALVLVPALVASFLVGSIAYERDADAEAASRIDGVIAGLTELVDFRAELMLARVPAEVQVRAGALGIGGDDALALLELEGDDLGDFSTVVTELEQVPEAQRPFGADRLRALEISLADGATIEDLDRFEQLEQITDAAWFRQVRALQDQIADLGSRSLTRQVRDLDAAAATASATGSMITRLADYWFAHLDAPERVEPARVRLGVARSQFDRAIERLDASVDPDVRTISSSIDDLWRSGPFFVAVNDASTGQPAAPFVGEPDLGLVVEAFTSSFELISPLFDLVNAQSDAVADGATAVADDALRTSRATLAVAIALVAGMVALSLAVARSLGRPLRRLIDGMREVGGGELGAEPLPDDGPREVVEASRAFNDVVLNLRLLELKLDALSNSDLDDPLLREPLPGQLGDALTRSVEVLSASIADRAELQERLAHQASHDALTGIANRAGALEALTAALARAQRQGTTLAIAFLDLDGFKQANDTYGHRAGDEVLREVARRLVDAARTGDSCARLGGDEFIVIAEDVDGAEGAMALARRVASVIAEPIEADGHQVRIGASIGLSLAEDGNDEPLDLLARADVAAYKAKRRQTVIELYDESLAARMRATLPRITDASEPAAPEVVPTDPPDQPTVVD